MDEGGYKVSGYPFNSQRSDIQPAGNCIITHP